MFYCSACGEIEHVCLPIVSLFMLCFSIALLFFYLRFLFSAYDHKISSKFFSK